MSELKTEVEHVIKTGRQIVEKKQVDFPDKLSKQLDAIKQLYNKLGIQVGTLKHNRKDLFFINLSDVFQNSEQDVFTSLQCIIFKHHK